MTGETEAQFDPRREQALAAMGITRWVLRQGQSELPYADNDIAVRSTPTSEAPSADTAQPGAPAARLDWDQLAARVAACEACELHSTRTQTVFGVGDRHAQLMVVGEAPGAEEDRRGEPFVGRAGQLLDAMLRAIGLDRNAVFIANILKCRPPRNRDPRPQEALACRAFLERQIALLEPRALLAVGRVAAQNLLQVDTPIGRMRGRVYEYGSQAIPVVVTYHPAYLLRSPGEKGKAWQDLLVARDLISGGDHQ